ncbi:hypothetical protein ACQRAW_06905 [Fusicatenibacter saccharivorans]|nr:hypothetical protein [Blautia obeum]
MTKYMKKNSLGILVESEDQHINSDTVEIRLTISEYKNLLDQMQLLQKELKEANENLILAKKQSTQEFEEKLQYFKEKAAQKMFELQKEANIKIKSALDAKAVAEDQLKNQIELNENLKRIARERANAARGIANKKQHDGYLVLSCRQWTEHYKYELSEAEYAEKSVEFKRTHSYPCAEYRTAPVWKSLLQTPYVSSIPLQNLIDLIEENDLWDKGILRDIGCTQMNASNINGYYQKFTNLNGDNVNGLFRWNYIANFRSGFWEMELYTTQCLQVPEYRRPRI